MISSVYVWVHLPGDTQATLCGRFTHSAADRNTPVGSFLYAKSYLANPSAIALDPIALPLIAKEFTTTALRGVFGALLDAVPDDWGRGVIDRIHGVQSFPSGYMLHTMDDAIGNVTFTATTSRKVEKEFPGTEILSDARSIALDLERGKTISPELASRFQINTAMGGARPKVTIAHDGCLWLAKLPSRKDNPLLPTAKLEMAMLALGDACGIQCAQGLVVLDDVLLVKRFDRAWVDPETRKDASTSGWRRDAFLSAKTVLASVPESFRSQYSESYVRLAQLLTRYSADAAADKIELYKRMIFNALISNTDDHERNHGILADDLPGTYRLSPAYDMVPRLHNTARRYQAMVVGAGQAIPTEENLLADCFAFGLSTSQASIILADLTHKVGYHWRDCLVQQGLSIDAIERISPCFANLPEIGDNVDVVANYDVPKGG